MTKLDAVDFGDIKDGVVIPAMVAMMEGQLAYEAGLPWITYRKYDQRYRSHWRQGWTTARNFKLALFQRYAAHRDKFDRHAGRNSAGQTIRAAEIAHHEARFPDFREAYEQYVEWQKVEWE